METGVAANGKHESYIMFNIHFSHDYEKDKRYNGWPGQPGANMEKI